MDRELQDCSYDSKHQNASIYIASYPSKVLTHSILEYQASNQGVDRILVVLNFHDCAICLNNQHSMHVLKNK